jgi:serine/threonine protein kinase
MAAILPTNNRTLESHNAEEERGMFGLTMIEFSDFLIDKCVGEGSFSHVFKVKIYKEGKLRSRLLEKGVIKPDDDENASFALKCPRTKDLSHEEAEQCSADLMNEANILSMLDHKNIIQIRGMSTTPEMILLELLETTLEDRIRYWRREKKALKVQNRGSLQSVLLLSSSHSKQQARLTALRTRTESLVTGIANGMAYLHSNNIVLRDLKPENIGFDSKGEVRLFDFGLACEANDTRKDEVAGSLRYMSPDSMLQAAGQLGELESEEMTQCGLASDVYSFGVVLWEILTLKKPYATLLARSQNGSVEGVATLLLENVAKQGWRPPTQGIPSKPLIELIEECWDHFRGGRPSFNNISVRLSNIYGSMVPQGSIGEGNTDSNFHRGMSGLRRSVSFGGVSSGSSSQVKIRWQDRVQKYRRRTVSSACEDCSKASLSMSEHGTAYTTPEDDLRSREPSREDSSDFRRLDDDDLLLDDNSSD